MTPEQLRTVLEQGKETPGTEFKSSGSRRERDFLARVVRAVLALANRRGGGVVILGVNDDGGRINPTGVAEDHLETWGPEAVTASVAAYADPYVDLTVHRIELERQNFIVLEVREFEEVPVLCKRGYGNLLRDGACYVRRRGRVESCEVPNNAEMRELLDLATEKGVRRFLQTAGRSGLLEEANGTGVQPNDDEQFERQAEEDL